MHELSLLPLFMDLRGKPVVLAGDIAGLVWKVELLVAAGALAKVFVADPEITVALTALDLGARLTLSDRAVVFGDFAGAKFAVGAFAEEIAAKNFAALARTAQLLVNLVDRPALSDVQFGAIVNRSPIVAAIATDGKAPSLGRAIRNRIETMLPPEIARWADAADVVRAQTNDLSPAQKRQFWAGYAQLALSQPKTTPTPEAIEALKVAAAQRFGDLIVLDVGPAKRYDLITLEALSYLQRADLIVVNQDVDARLLDIVRREATLLRLSEESNPEHAAQKCVSCAEDGLCVVWLHISGQAPDVSQWPKSNVIIRHLKPGA